eukprot:466641_1
MAATCTSLITFIIVLILNTQQAQFTLPQTAEPVPTNTAVATQICLWNSVTIPNLNGLYNYESKQYVLTRGSNTCEGSTDTYYIHNSNSNGHWVITNSTQTVQYMAECTTYQPNINVYECGSWSIQLTITLGECPTLTCPEIIVSDMENYKYCTGTYTLRLSGSNQYFSALNSNYMFFHPPTFKWYCSGARPDMNICDIPQYIISGLYEEWSTLTNSGDSFLWRLDVIPSASVQITCAASTTAPFITTIPFISDTTVPVTTIIPFITTSVNIKTTSNIVTTIASEELCVWSVLLDNAVLNGQYIFGGEFDGYSFWKMSIDESCGVRQYTIFKNSDSLKWIIGDEDFNFANIYAECMDYISPKYPSLCMNWNVDGMKVFYGTCPVLDCNYIQLNNAGDCSGVFKRHEGPLNIFKNVYQGVIIPKTFYFDQYTFSWKCGESYVDDACKENTVIDLEAMSNVWIDIHIGDSNEFLLIDGSSYTAICLDSTNITTTAISTSSIPTSIPTSMPTPTFTGICVWGYADYKMNGEYIVNVNKHNQRLSYTMQLDSSLNCEVTHFMVFFSYDNDGQWVIASSFQGYPIAYCTMDIQPYSPDKCNGKWSVSDIQITSTICPILSCEELIIDNSELCSGIFVKTDNNVYLAEDVSKYLYFNQHLFSWICAHNVVYSCSTDIYIERYTSQWKFMYNNEITEITILNGSQVNITCNGGGERPPITTNDDIYITIDYDRDMSQDKFNLMDELGVTMLQFILGSSGTLVGLCICLSICFYYVFMKKRKHKIRDMGTTVAFDRISVKSMSMTTLTDNTQRHAIEMVSMSDTHRINSDTAGMSDEGDITLGGVLINIGNTNSPRSKGINITTTLNSKKGVAFDRFNTEELYSVTDNDNNLSMQSLTPRGSDKQNKRFSAISNGTSIQSDGDVLNSMQLNKETLKPPDPSQVQGAEFNRLDSEDLYRSHNNNVSKITPNGNNNEPMDTVRYKHEEKEIETEIEIEIEVEVKEMEIPDIPKEI